MDEELVFADRRLEMLPELVCATVVPETTDALYAQRKNSWDVAAHQHLFGGCCGTHGSGLFWQVFLCLPCTRHNCGVRINVSLDIWTELQDMLRVFLVLVHFLTAIRERLINWPVVTMYILTFAMQWGIALATVKTKLVRADMKLDKDVAGRVVFWFPLYRFVMSFVRVGALVRYLSLYGAIERDAIPIVDRGFPPPNKEAFQALVGRREHKPQTRKMPEVTADMIEALIGNGVAKKEAAWTPASVDSFVTACGGFSDYDE